MSKIVDNPYVKKFNDVVKDIKRYPYKIRFIKNPCEELQLLAVSKDGLALRYIENPCSEAKTTAVMQNGKSIQYS